MGMLLLNGSTDLNPRTLFANGEQGLWLDPSDMTAGKAGWRRNLLTYSAATAGAVTGTPGTGPTGWTASGSDGSLTVESDGLRLTIASGRRSFFQAVTLEAGRTYCFSAICDIYTTEPIHQIFEMSLLPAGTTVTKYQDNALLTEFQAPSVALNTELKLVVQVGGTGGAARVNFGAGINAIGTDGDITFKRFQFELGSTRSEYQPITDFSTEFKAAFPTHTLYQDSNGVTPCTAAGDPVGLILDQSRGGLGALGPELVTNGGFDSNLTGWNIDFSTGTGSVSVVSNQAVITRVDGSNIGNLDQSISTVSGAFYRLTFTASGASSTRLIIGSSQGASNILVVNTITGVYSTFFQATSSTTWIRFNGTVNSSSNTVDDVSVKLVPGNHAYQTTSASRPTLARIPVSGRRNLLTRTEEFDNAAWAKSNTTTSANTSETADPLGTNTADKILETTATGTHTVRQTVAVTSGQNITFSFYAKAAGRNFVRFWEDVTTGKQGYFDLANGTATNSDLSSVAIQSVGNGWYRCSGTINSFAGTSYGFRIHTSADGTTTSFAGDDTKGVYLWGAQLETGSTATNYQKVVATTDVTESGVGDLWHLVFDGSDDSLVTNSVDFATWTQETRRNLLTNGEDFDNAAWTKDNSATVTANSTTAPEGTATADTITAGTTGTFRQVRQLFALSSGNQRTFTCYLKAGATNVAYLLASDMAAHADGRYFDLANGTLGGQTGLTVGSNVTLNDSSIESVGSGWYRCRITVTVSASTTFSFLIGIADANNSVTSTANKTILAWGAQLETGSTATAYQRVGTDEMTVIAGVRKLQNSTTGMIAELSVTSSANNGAFWVLDGNKSGGGADKLSWRSRGTAGSTCDGNVAVNTSVVFTGSGDISGDVSVQRINAIETESNVTDQGTGNFGNHVLYIGRRASSSLPFNGHLYQLIIRGLTTPTGKLIEAERFVARKTGVTGI